MREPSAPGDSRMFRVASDALTKGPRRRQASAPNHLVRGVPWNEPYGTASHQLLRFEHDSIQQSTITPARVVGLWASMLNHLPHTRQPHRLTVGELGHNRQIPTHGFDGLSERGQKEIASLFEMRHYPA